jgi:hypothetical protein
LGQTDKISDAGISIIQPEINQAVARDAKTPRL